MRRIVCGRPVLAYVDAALRSSHDEHASGIGLEQKGQLIAGVKFDSWNGASICMHVAAEPGSQWMTRAYLHACFDYPFNQLGVVKILGPVRSTNAAARRFDEHLGFTVEATLKDAAPGGDILIYSMTRSECRFLKMRQTA